MYGEIFECSFWKIFDFNLKVFEKNWVDISEFRDNFKIAVELLRWIKS